MVDAPRDGHFHLIDQLPAALVDETMFLSAALSLSLLSPIFVLHSPGLHWPYSIPSHPPGVSGLRYRCHRPPSELQVKHCLPACSASAFPLFPLKFCPCPGWPSDSPLEAWTASSPPSSLLQTLDMMGRCMDDVV